MGQHKLIVKKTNDEDSLDLHWVMAMFDWNVAVNSPQHMLEIKETDTALSLKFTSECCLYYAMGRFDRDGIHYYKPDKNASIHDMRIRLIQRRIMKNSNTRSEANHKIYVRTVNPASRLDESQLWHDMNKRHDLCSVCVKAASRYAFLSFATAASVWYTVGYFELDTFYDVQVKRMIAE